MMAPPALRPYRPGRQPRSARWPYRPLLRLNSAALPDNPRARAFMRMLTGCSRLSHRNARDIPGLCWDPTYGVSSLKQLEEGLEVLIRSLGEICYSSVLMELLIILFPDERYRRETRHHETGELVNGVWHFAGTSGWAAVAEEVYVLDGPLRPPG
ncbi:hypothetical protein DOX71_20730 [Cronobacter sakazakii]|nr:hypothetical protein [Cronobacter sakazakii]